MLESPRILPSNAVSSATIISFMTYSIASFVNCFHAFVVTRPQETMGEQTIYVHISKSCRSAMFCPLCGKGPVQVDQSKSTFACPKCKYHGPPRSRKQHLIDNDHLSGSVLIAAERYWLKIYAVASAVPSTTSGVLEQSRGDRRQKPFW